MDFRMTSATAREGIKSGPAASNDYDAANFDSRI